MANQDPFTVTSDDVPNADSTVVASGDQETTSGSKRADGMFVSFKMQFVVGVLVSSLPSELASRSGKQKNNHVHLKDRLQHHPFHSSDTLDPPIVAAPKLSENDPCSQLQSPVA
jgi:hypothetical protein